MSGCRLQRYPTWCDPTTRLCADAVCQIEIQLCARFAGQVCAGAPGRAAAMRSVPPMQVASGRGAPCYLRSDDGPECVSVALLKWILEQRIKSVLIDPRKSWQTGTTDNFNGKFRDECLAMEWFENHVEAKVSIEDWRQHLNTVRPNSSLHYKTPDALSKKKPKRLLITATPNCVCPKNRAGQVSKNHIG